jgi:two-component system chemotaxis sensor kinase CheA
LRPFLETYALEDRRAASIMQDLDMVTSDIQESIMQMRMQPVIDLLGKYKRVVRDIARRISKRVDLILEGSDVEVDRNVLEKLANPVTHLIRNCIDHGIELPEERRKRSKPETGTIWIRTSHQGGQVHLEISDDGRGIDPQLILSKAFEKGLVTEDQLEALTDKQKINLIFLPGFSTAEQITDISGRGVGMDVVKTNIGRLRGQIEIDSVKGEGTRVHLIIPLTLAIVPSLIVSVGEFKFAIPQVSIKEIIFLEPGQMHQQVEKLAGSEVLRLRGRLLPILRLRNVLGIKTFILEPGSGKKAEEKRKAIADRRGEPMEKDFSGHRRLKKDRRKTHWDTTHVVILKLGPHIFGLCVDELFDIHEVVVEPLSEYLRHLGCFAGTTILGDGDVIMVLDVPGIADYSTLKLDAIKQEELKRNQLQKQNADPNAEKRSLLVFCNTRKEYFALELHSVARLEPLQPKDIHFTGDLKYMKYQEQAVQLFSMDEFLQAGRVSLDEPEFYAIFPKNLTSRVGIMVSNIIDTIETRDKIDRDDACPDFVRGKIFIEDMMVQVLDHEKFTDLIEQKRDVQKTLFKEVNENTDR